MEKRNRPLYRVGDEIKVDINEVKKDEYVADSFIKYIPKHNENDLFITKVFSKEYSKKEHMYQINGLFNLQENEIILIERGVNNGTI